MIIKVKSRDGSTDLSFDSESFHVSIQMSESELNVLKSMEAREDGASPEGRSYRTFAAIMPSSDKEEAHLSSWAKE